MKNKIKKAIKKVESKKFQKKVDKGLVVVMILMIAAMESLILRDIVMVAHAILTDPILGDDRVSDARRTWENPPLPEVSTQVDGALDRVESEGVEASNRSASSLESLIRETFPEDPDTAVAIFKTESGLDPEKDSNSDRMADGRPFSVGVAQINLTVSNVGGLDCPKAFTGRNYHANVTDESLYQACVKAAKTPKIAMETARKKYESAIGFNHWTVFKTKSYLKNL